jgi:hypothetical protein
MNPNVTILQGTRYVRPVDVARMILRNRRLQRTDNVYLECVTSWAEIKRATRAFSEVLRAPLLEDPNAFLDWYRAEHLKVKGPK